MKLLYGDQEHSQPRLYWEKWCLVCWRKGLCWNDCCRYCRDSVCVAMPCSQCSCCHILESASCMSEEGWNSCWALLQELYVLPQTQHGNMLYVWQQQCCNHCSLKIPGQTAQMSGSDPWITACDAFWTLNYRTVTAHVSCNWGHHCVGISCGSQQLGRLLIVSIRGNVTVHHMHGYRCGQSVTSRIPLQSEGLWSSRQQLCRSGLWCFPCDVCTLRWNAAGISKSNFVRSNSMQRSKIKHKMRKMMSIFMDYAKDEVQASKQQLQKLLSIFMG